MPSVSAEELLLYAKTAALADDNGNDVRAELFSLAMEEDDKVNAYFREQYKASVLEHCKAMVKIEMERIVAAGNANFIRRAKRQKQSLLEMTEFCKFNTRLRSKGVDLDKECITWDGELSKLFDLLVSRFAPQGPEDALKLVIVQWLRSGEMSWEIFQQWHAWHTRGVDLCTLRQVEWAQATPRDIIFGDFKRALAAMPTDDFVIKEDLQEQLSVLLEQPKFKTTGDSKCKTLVVEGPTVYLSQVKARVEEYLEDKSVIEVNIFAWDVLQVDTDLTAMHWHGKNLCVVSEKVNVMGTSTIDVSGTGYAQVKSKAAKGTAGTASAPGGKGHDGEDGHAGESSGNITIITKEMINASCLTLKLNGGNGEHGQSGGDGGDGVDGAGVTEEYLNEIKIKYDSLYRTSWIQFYEYTPKGCMSASRDTVKWEEYISKEFNDAAGRTIIYSVAKNRGWVYSLYELYFIIKGTDGTGGGPGGKNGCGGEGGNHGECTLINSDTNEALDTSEMFRVQVEKNMGKSGEDGDVGACGIFGTNGNDRGFIDRSAKESSYVPYGTNGNKRLTRKWDYSSGKYNRVDGYRKHYLKEAAHFTRIEEGDIPAVSSKQTRQKLEKKTQRCTWAETVAKKSIVTSSVMEKASEYFAAYNKRLSLATILQQCVKNVQDAQEIEQEEQESVEQQVTVIHKSPDEEDYGKRRGRRSTLNPVLYVKKLLANKNNETLGTAAQEVIDFFQIEFDNDHLQQISLRVIRIFAKFRRVMEHNIIRAVIAVIQQKTPDGLKYEELVRLHKNLTKSRHDKVALIKFRSKMSAFFTQYQNGNFDIDTSLALDNNTLRAITAIVNDVDNEDNNNTWRRYTLAENTSDVTARLFQEYPKNEVELDVLLEINTAFEKIDTAFAQYLGQFAQVDEFNWANNAAWDKLRKSFHLEQMTTKSDEKPEGADYGKNETAGSDMRNSELATEEEQPAKAKDKKSFFSNPFNSKEKTASLKDELSSIPSQIMSTLAPDRKPEFIDSVEELMETIAKSKDFYNNALEKLHTAFSTNREYTRRFGNVPKASQSAHENGAAALFLIRFYFQMRKLLTFNTHLLMCNLLFHRHVRHPIEMSQFARPETQAKRLTKLVKLIKKQKMNLSSQDCKKFMSEHGFHCAAFRYLLAITLNQRVQIYGNKDYSDVQLFEDWNCDGEQLVRFYSDGKCFYPIVPDLKLREMQTAREKARCEFEKDLSAKKQQLDALSWDYTREHDKNRFCSLFPEEYKDTVSEWVDCYVHAVGDGNMHLLRMLEQRITLDGCHISVVELQFVLTTTALLQSKYHVSADFILSLAASTSQTQLVDAFLYMRIEAAWRRRIDKRYRDEIINSLAFITNNRLKIMLGAKLAQQRRLNEATLLKVCLMLRHVAKNNQQLERMSLDEWIDVSERQNWSTINESMRELGSVGYYLTFLNHRKCADEPALRSLFTRKQHWQHLVIPEKLIAKIFFLIAYQEVDVNREYIDTLDHLLDLISKQVRSDCDNDNDVGGESDFGYRLLTNECKQKAVLDNIKTYAGATLEVLLSEKPRNMNTLTEMIVGIHDDDETKQKRREWIVSVAEGLRVREPVTAISTNVKLLHEIDEKLNKLHGVHLRDTQKMAILCAVESDKNLLSQVNTGEGKSYIVSAIAIMRAHQHGYVDVITSSPVLAQRDAEEMADLYRAMGISVGHNCDEEIEKRKLAYKCNVVYGDIGHFQRDHLLHHFYRKNILGDRMRVAVIVDEVDNMLLDNGNNMLYLSHNVAGLEMLDSLFVFIQRVVNAPILHGDRDKKQDGHEQFNSEHIRQQVKADLLGHMPQSDIAKMAVDDETRDHTERIWTKLIEQEVIDVDGFLMIATAEEFMTRRESVKQSLSAITTVSLASRIVTALTIVVNRERQIRVPRYLFDFCLRHLDQYIENCKRAMFIRHNEEYVVDIDHTGTSGDIQPKITIIDGNTGIDLVTSQWSEGLHQSVQLKHGCRLAPVSLKAVFVSNVSYLCGYKYINGLSGTLGSIEESKTLVDLYKADLIRLPTWRAKNFYEHVPLICTGERDWIDKIYTKVEDQVLASRSVLVICRTIADVLKIVDGLLDRYNQTPRRSIKMQECFENMVTYQREFDAFDFGDKTKLRPGRLLIATNLAGRGTDIKLSDELKATGGMHVIVSFLPENSRIEDQAFGRAARCGDPGSGQIIMLTKNTATDGQPPSVFQLKEFRDNAEVHRLQSMDRFYHYHTEIKETCLTRFQKHCTAALEKVSARRSDEALPDEHEVIYFALLDEWAMWLDEKSAAIKQCATNCNDNEKANIVASVDAFLRSHPIDSISQAIRWINAPHSLLSLGLIQISQEHFSTANQTFDSIIDRFPDCAGEAYYYKAMILQRDVRKVKNLPDLRKNKVTDRLVSLVPERVREAVDWTKKNIKDYIPDEQCEVDEMAKLDTEDFFLQARRTFMMRSEHKTHLNTIVSRLQIAAGPQLVCVSGFKEQTKETKDMYDCLISNIDDLIGHPVNASTFNVFGDEYENAVQFKLMQSAGYVTPTMMSHIIRPDQLEALKWKYMISKRNLLKIFDGILKDECPVKFYERIVFPQEDVLRKCQLPNREEFWTNLRISGCFEHEEPFYFIDELRSANVPEVKSFTQLKPLTMKQKQFGIHLSDENMETLTRYAVDSVHEAFTGHERRLAWLLETGQLVRNAIAIVDLDKCRGAKFMQNFDYFTERDLADFLEIGELEVRWILHNLINAGVLYARTLTLQKLDREASLDGVPEEFKATCVRILRSVELLRMDDVSNATLAKCLNVQSQETVERARQVLLEHKVLIDNTKVFYFQASNAISCSSLPTCMQANVEMFLYHRFSYTFAFNCLYKSLVLSVDEPSTRKEIMLPRWAHKEFLQSLVDYGIVHAPRCEVREREFIDDAKRVEEVEKKVKSRLFIKSGELIATKKYFKDERLRVCADVKMAALNNMRQVGKINENYSWIFWLALKVAFTIFMSWSLVGAVNLAITVVANYGTICAIALMVVAAVGTLLYFVQSYKAKYKTQTVHDEPLHEFTQIVDFHGKCIERLNVHKKNTILIDACNEMITSSANKLQEHICSKLHVPEAIFNTVKAQFSLMSGAEADLKAFIDAALDQPMSMKHVRNCMRDILAIESIGIQTDIFTLLKQHHEDGHFDRAVIIDKLHAIRSQTLNMKIPLLESLMDKFSEELVSAIQQEIEMGASVKRKQVRIWYKDEVADDRSSVSSDSEALSDNDEDEIEGSSRGEKSLPEILADYWRRSLITIVHFEIRKEVRDRLFAPTRKLIEGYIADSEISLRKVDDEQQFLRKQAEQKLHLEERAQNVLAHQNSRYITHDLQHIIAQHWKTTHSIPLLTLMIQYCHPLPVASVPFVAHALHKLVERHTAGFRGLLLFVQTTNGKYAIHETVKNADEEPGCETVVIILHHEYFYLTQSDYMRSAAERKKLKTNDVIQACVYNVLARKLRVADALLKLGETHFRKSVVEILNALENDEQGTV
uniref:Chloroplast protein-transporting ATPase n=1 Tax=Plectus sambesii TaxID=2011161 RepID=A0A914XMC0_9BILA